MTDQHALSLLHQRGSVSALKIGKPLPSIVLAACIAALSSIGMTTAQAKQQCSVAVPSDTHGQWWSYRLVDGRKCWYAGKPGLSKSLLEWPKEKSERPGSSREVTGDVTVKPANPLDSQAWAPKGSVTLGRFGDWTITKKDSVITLHSDTGNLAVRCSDATMTYMAFIRISDPRSTTGRPEAKPTNFNFTAWADSNEPADFTFLVPYASDAYATGIVLLNPKFADQNTKFWAILKSARSRFSYNTSTGTISVNAVDLSPAIARFQEECFKIFKANAHHRLDEPIPLDWLRR
ncbi:hypothetical protein [Bradyrhizobium sp. AS23.2]|uniref:hypothetical protein n=1 Tax=Bradyrhizobium sp. AS23.2 TaxID=1680155 RepID=UPI001AD7FC44|nr:hypothetical protein [Bradyrhizobium sp. AS23.2]